MKKCTICGKVLLNEDKELSYFCNGRHDKDLEKTYEQVKRSNKENAEHWENGRETHNARP